VYDFSFGKEPPQKIFGIPLPEFLANLQSSSEGHAAGALPCIRPLANTVVNAMDYAIEGREGVPTPILEHGLWLCICRIDDLLKDNVFSEIAWETVRSSLEDLYDFSIPHWRSKPYPQILESFVRGGISEDSIRAAYYDLLHIIMTGSPAGEKRRDKDGVLVTLPYLKRKLGAEQGAKVFRDCEVLVGARPATLETGLVPYVT
jgi:hypothetical protein